ncbi:cyclin-dependent protein kinase, partial [Coemansia sp. RSA 2523]
VKMEKKQIPFQRNQMHRILEVLGTPTRDMWPTVELMPDYAQMKQFRQYPNALKTWYSNTGQKSDTGLELLVSLLEYDPERRVTAAQALEHAYFGEEPRPVRHPFLEQNTSYPKRRLTLDELCDAKAQHKLHTEPGQPGDQTVDTVMDDEWLDPHGIMREVREVREGRKVMGGMENGSDTDSDLDLPDPDS